MAKIFYTEKEIEDMFKAGIMSLEVGPDVVLTELAYEKAMSIGMKLLRDQPDNPPCAPVRPYISRHQGRGIPVSEAPAGAMPFHEPSAGSPAQGGEMSLQERIRSAVVARLGEKVDSNLLDVIVKRVMSSTGIKDPVCCSAESGARPCAPSSITEPRG